MITKRLFLQFGVCLIVSALAVSCSNGKPDDTATVATPLKSTQTPEDTSAPEFHYQFSNEAKAFSLQGSRAREIYLASGTHIEIPENCFVDAAGKRIIGTVDLSFEEFLTPGSIITSQISMKYDSAGTSSDFESAGMFRIGATQNGQEVYIAPGKTIRVSLATVDTDKGYKSYYSTHDGSDWSYLDKSKPVPNEKKKESIAAAKDVLANTPKPMKPIAYSANGKYFDLNLSLAYTSDLKSLLGVVWEYAGDNKKNDPAQNKSQYGKDWDFVNIIPAEGSKRGVYDIVLQNKDTTVKTTARPVFRGAVLDAENELFTAELGEFNKRMAAARQEQEQAIAEASFLRVINIKNMGLYNYDRQYHNSDAIPILANFNFGADSLKKYPISVFLITGNGMAVIKYPPHDWEKFMYVRKDINKLIAILPNQEICTLTAKEFAHEAPVFPVDKPGKYTFKLNHTGVMASSAKDIDKIISGL
ncbi:MAG: hypothetical protein JST26_05390 [Bacteroidetes bacterium]|nr:hypothetical protein [Bacteroidota bacterium]